MINDQRRCIRGIGHRRIAERDHDLVRRIGHEPHRRADDHRQRALAASQESGHVEAVLRQQMLQAVARHLSPEAPELGADDAEIRLHDRLQRSEASVVITVCRPVKLDMFTGAGDHLEPDHIVGGSAVPESPRTACVVPDHPADGAAVVGRWIRPETQAVRGRCGL